VFTILFSYWTTNKVRIGHTPFQLVYGLHLLLPIKYLLPFKLGDNKDPQHVEVWTDWLFELNKLQENMLIAQDLVAQDLLLTSGINHCGHKIDTLIPSFNLESM
jgi:hypothetical protein